MPGIVELILMYYQVERLTNQVNEYLDIHLLPSQFVLLVSVLVAVSISSVCYKSFY